MTVLEYYLNQQQIETWKKKFLSTSVSQSGKLYSYYTTNMKKGIYSLLTQFSAFLPKINIDRAMWNDNMRSGQEADKHRIISLINAGLIRNSDTKYLFTYKSVTMNDICNAELRDCEKWFLLLLLVIDYDCEARKLDLLKTTKETFDLFKDSEISSEYIMEKLKSALHYTDREELFNADIFWLVNFVRDSDFIKKYFNATSEEKESLHSYVLNCRQNENTQDLIAVKFKNGGAITPTGFVDELKVLYFSKIILSNATDSFDTYIGKTIDEFENRFPLARKDKIYNFILNHKSVYTLVFNRIKENFTCH